MIKRFTLLAICALTVQAYNLRTTGTQQAPSRLLRETAAFSAVKQADEKLLLGVLKGIYQSTGASTILKKLKKSGYDMRIQHGTVPKSNMRRPTYTAKNTVLTSLLLQQPLANDAKLSKIRENIFRVTSVHFSLKEFKTIRNKLRDARLQRSRPSDFRATERDCFFFTAPHAIALERDGDKKTHDREYHTNEIVNRFAKALNGGYITWSPQELTRINEVGFVDNKQSRNKMDPSNRDPNYQSDAEQAEGQYNPWIDALQKARRQCRGGSRLEDRGLHVDVHGMSNEHGVDLVIGTKGMFRNKSIAQERVRILEMHLYNKLAPILKEMTPATGKASTGKWLGKRANGKPVRHPKQKQILLFNQKFEQPYTFPGALQNGFSGGLPGPKDAGYRTMTLTSTDADVFNRVGLEPFAMAIQMEMSTNLRTKLANDTDLARKFARAIKSAYRSTAACTGKTSHCSLIPGSGAWKPRNSRRVYDKLINAKVKPCEILSATTVELRKYINNRIKTNSKNKRAQPEPNTKGIGAESFKKLQQHFRLFGVRTCPVQRSASRTLLRSSEGE